MSEALKCPRCKIEMIYDEEKEFWRCPKCGGEFWEDVDELDMIRQHEQARVYAEDLRRITLWGISKPGAAALPPVAVVVPGKGSRKAGRKWKSGRQYKPWTQRYMMV